MAESVLKVSSKPLMAKRRLRSWLWVYGFAAVLLAAVAVLGFDAYSGRIGILSPRFEIVVNGAGRIIRVPAGGSVQAAIEQANGGDIVELQAGAVYYGEIKLPNKPLADYVTIQSSQAAMLPVDKRVGPAQSGLMAKIVTPKGGKPTVSAANGAHHYRFVGIEFAAGNAEYVYNLVLFGNNETSPDHVPHDLEIDRSYLHPSQTGKVRRGIAVNSANTTIRNSYIEGFAFENEETQGICGWTGSKNVRILNNYVEGGAENIMFGGSDPVSADLIPTGIEIRGNHLNKPAEWVGKTSLKTLFELKDATHVQFVGNYLANNWVGPAFRITVRDQDGKADFSTVEDVLIKDNIINGAGAGMNILGKDDLFPSQTLKRLTIVNNLFLNLGGKGFDGGGYFVQIADGEEILIANNTAFNLGNIATFYAAMPSGFVFRDNITGHGKYGIHGLANMNTAESRGLFQNNIFINNLRVPPSDYSFPNGNTLVTDIRDLGFVNAAANDFRLASNSRFKGKARGGKDVGSDLTLKPTQEY